MSEEIRRLKDEFLEYLYEISKMKMVSYIATFIQGEDAFLLRLLMNGEMSPKELSLELKITKGRVTVLMNKLRNKKFILTKDNIKDRRSLIIEITELGQNYLEEKLRIADNYFSTLFDILGQKDALSLNNQIKNLLDKVKEGGLDE